MKLVSFENCILQPAKELYSCCGAYVIARGFDISNRKYYMASRINKTGDKVYIGQAITQKSAELICEGYEQTIQEELLVLGTLFQNWSDKKSDFEQKCLKAFLDGDYVLLSDVINELKNSI